MYVTACGKNVNLAKEFDLFTRRRRNPNPKYENGFNIYGTWRRVTFEKLMMKNDFFIRLSRLATPYNIVQKSLRRRKIFYTILYGVTKQLSQIKKIINFHH